MHLLFFHEQSLFKQLALGWQIAKKLSGLNHFFTKQQYKPQIKGKWSFSFVINVKQLSNGQYTTIQLSQKHYLENFKITDHKY